MKQSLQLKLGQQLSITPQLQQAIKLLQLSTADLELEIQENLEKNVMLEDKESTKDNLPSEQLSIETKWENDYQITGSNSFSNNYDNTQFIESSSAKTNIDNNLQEYLSWQLNLSNFTPNDKNIANTIIDAISDDGYLTISLDEVQESIKPQEACRSDIEIVLHRIQHFDPVGVGSRNLTECLQIQLNLLPKDTPYFKKTEKLINNHLDLLAKKNFNKIKSKLKLSDHELEMIVTILTKLNPRPGTNISSTTTEYIIPDVIITKQKNTWQIELNKNFTHNIRINANYAAMIKKSHSQRDNKFLQDQLSEAKWFLKSLQNRNDTLLKVTTHIVHQQQEFLEHGVEAMKPLVLQDIATAVNLHESTISRVTTNKYVHTPKGVFELKYFFSNAINNAATGSQHSATAIREIIKKLISTEPGSKPLTDHKIGQLLSQQDINIARRTVAKYRESLGISPSNQRKKLNRSTL